MAIQGQVQAPGSPADKLVTAWYALTAEQVAAKLGGGYPDKLGKLVGIDMGDSFIVELLQNFTVNAQALDRLDGCLLTVLFGGQLFTHQYFYLI